MKDTFTVKEIMNGTGLTRQRVHALIKSRKIPVIRKNKHLLLKWQDLLKIADNPTILGFLKWTLVSEKKRVEDIYKVIKEHAKGMIYAYVFFLEKQFPTPEGTDPDWISLLQMAQKYTQLSTQMLLDFRSALDSDIDVVDFLTKPLLKETNG